jgi:DNA-directed RNA polymerase subunit RPC12/RpoP
MYTCDRCSKTFSKISNYKGHINRKNPCKSILNTELDLITNISNAIESNIDIELPNETECPHCKKNFYSKGNTIKHIYNNCKIKKQENKSSEIMDKVKKLLDEQLSKNNTNNITNNNITNNNITNNITNNVNITIFSAGKEDLSRLTQEEILKICTSGTYYPLVAAEIIHCNEKYPEFQNFLISNLRSNTGLVFINDKWVSKTQDEIISNIMNIDKKHVSKLIKDLKVDNMLQVKLESTKEEIENNESKEHQKSKIKSRLYNASKMVNKNKKNTEKTITN